MVRLKATSQIMKRLEMDDFNSSMVRLKVDKKACHLASTLLYFNSSMVRLKGKL